MGSFRSLAWAAVLAVVTLPLRAQEPGGVFCRTIGFESLADSVPIGTLAGNPSVSFGSSWLSLIDSDAGGSGHFANEPSASTVAYFVSPADPIDFSPAVKHIELSYVASQLSLPLSILAWDGPAGTGAVVASATGTVLGTDFDGAACSGDPGGEFCLWDRVTLASGTADIRSLTLEGSFANQIGIDDLFVCTADPCFTAANVTPVPDPTGLNSPGSLLPFPSANAPFIGNAFFGLRVDDPGNVCGLHPGAVTQILVSTTQGQATLPNAGCAPGTDGTIQIGLGGTLLLSSFLAWPGPGTGAQHTIPVPPNPSLCGIVCYGQGYWFDTQGPVNRLVLTERVDLVFGY